MVPDVKIFADFQNADKQGRVRLNTKGTFDDIERYNIDLKPGIEVLLVDGDGLKAMGTVEYSEEEKIWVASIDWEKF